MTSYLGAVGALQRTVEDLDLDLAFDALLKKTSDKDARVTLEAKETLLKRPLARLFANAHVLGGFLRRFDGELWSVAKGKPRFLASPVRFLDELYHFLDLETRADKPPAEQIWEHDAEILGAAKAFYAEVEARTGAASASELEALFSGKPNARLCGKDAELWQRCVASHRGFQLGSELLLLCRASARSAASSVVNSNRDGESADSSLYYTDGYSYSLADPYRYGHSDLDIYTDTKYHAFDHADFHTDVHQSSSS